LGLIPADYQVLDPIKVRASDYGAPTTRTRVFFIGYDGNRISQLQLADFLPNEVEDVRVRDALNGLPAIRAKWQSEAQSWRSVGELPQTRYGISISASIPEGMGDADAVQLYKQRRQVSGFLGTIHTPETIERFKSLAPGQRDSISKAMRLDQHGYCPTIRAGTGPERGSYQAIRPVHPSSPRVISPREAARLQGFPDWFQFHPTKWHAFRQIGNSVSPIVAESLLSVISRAAA
jgi:DNA (cytosine-5)-methyltransferase 1